MPFCAVSTRTYSYKCNQRQRRQRQAQRRAHQGRFHVIGQPQTQRAFVEAKALLNHEGLPSVKRHVQQGIDRHERRQQRQRLQKRARPQPLKQQGVERVQPR